MRMERHECSGREREHIYVVACVAAMRCGNYAPDAQIGCFPYASWFRVQPAGVKVASLSASRFAQLRSGELSIKLNSTKKDHGS